MKKRDLIKLFTLSKFDVIFPLISGRTNAINSNDDKRYFVTISADGGWDTTALFDPKGTSNGVNKVSRDSSLITPDGLKWSAIPNIDGHKRIQNQYKNFFTQYSPQLTIVRGVDAMTTNHTLGMKATWSGDFRTNPAIGALYGAVHGANLPLSYVAFGGEYGGNDYTAGLDVSKALLSGRGPLKKMLSPSICQRSGIYGMEAEKAWGRSEKCLENEKKPAQDIALPTQKMGKMLQQRLQPNVFSELYDNLKQLKSVKNFCGNWNRGRSARLKGQAQIAAASFATGTTVSASLNMRGFDTHCNNNAQYSLLGDMLEGIHYLVQALNFYGLADKTVIMVSSDLGRSPLHNSRGGKDHYSLTGQMILHPKSSGLGGSYFGESTDSYKRHKIDMHTGTPDLHGTYLNTRHTLHAMREYLNLNGTVQAGQFPLNTTLMPNLFGKKCQEPSLRPF